MAVRYVTLDFNSVDHEKVSRAWFVLLWDLHYHDPVTFNVNEGHRTMARQRELVAEKGVWSSSNPTGAARPSPRAPHIRTGFCDHAIDFNNAAAVVTAMAKHGVHAVRPLPSEPWHVEPNRADLLRYYRMNAKRVDREKRERDKKR